MPRAVVAVAYGGPENLDIIDIPSREVGPGEATFAVRAAALNPVDSKMIAGSRGGDPAKLPLRVGNEASGVVTDVWRDTVAGDGEPLAVGDEVIGYRVGGALASELTAKAADLFHKPASVSFEEGAGLLLVGVTAVHALEASGVQDGQTLLIHGVAGSVGRVAAQLALRRGIHVIGTAAEGRKDELEALGVTHVTYGDGLEGRVRAAAPNGVDAAIDTVGTDEALAVSLAVVADRAHLVTIANGPGFLDAGAKYIGGGPGADPGTELRNAARAELVKLAGEGAISLPVAATYPLDQVQDAFRFMNDGHAGGKVVVVP